MLRINDFHSWACGTFALIITFYKITVILLQIVMESWDSSCNKSVNLENDAKTLFYSLLKLKYSPSKYLEHKKDLSKHASLNNTHRNHSFLPYKKSSNRSIVWLLCILRGACHVLHLWGFLSARDAEVTESLQM